MHCDRRPGGRALLLLIALLCSTAVPRAFVVCVSEGDHVSLEAAFEADPCETKFIFGARSDVAWPTATCTDIPAIQLSARTDDSQAQIETLAMFQPDFPAYPAPIRHRTDGRDVPSPRKIDHLVLRTTVLRL